jgi:nicotinamide mononucleotide (NMN) deamidase PncC
VPAEGHQARYDRELHQGIIAAALTAAADCSDAVERSFVTNSNEAKTELGVPTELGSAGPAR